MVLNSKPRTNESNSPNRAMSLPSGQSNPQQSISEPVDSFPATASYPNPRTETPTSPATQSQILPDGTARHKMVKNSAWPHSHPMFWDDARNDQSSSEWPDFSSLKTPAGSVTVPNVPEAPSQAGQVALGLLPSDLQRSQIERESGPQAQSPPNPSPSEPPRKMNPGYDRERDEQLKTVIADAQRNYSNGPMWGVATAPPISFKASDDNWSLGFRRPLGTNQGSEMDIISAAERAMGEPSPAAAAARDGRRQSQGVETPQRAVEVEKEEREKREQEERLKESEGDVTREQRIAFANGESTQTRREASKRWFGTGSIWSIS